ncbi:HNH endonuclease signature motif containing protein [Corynebacterium renale]|uniref:HNH endonuclease n=2 Tax=Corynebacterium renale TaxID=1724 RepID=A0A2A9DPU3_9CORY|nr:HNH endonuclease signature motif containing protein [Corynebacterium renale]PFG27940.1 HNH endonuclease [Corynebacterium renale]SQI21649.1 Endonuclease [Corynebacterium renale]STC99616.1 Endonuclease [Corynebacterium renale]
MLTTYLQATRGGIALIRESGGFTLEQLVAMGATRDHAQALHDAFALFYGRTRYTAQQRRAQRTGLSLDGLLAVVTYSKRTQSVADTWKLVVELCALDGGPTEIRSVALARLREWYPPRTRKDGVYMQRPKGKSWTLSIQGSADLIASLGAQIKTLDDAENVFRDGATKFGVITNIIVPIDDLWKLKYDNPEDVTLQCTNGVTLTGTEYLQRAVGTFFRGLLWHPMKGIINAGQTQRFANPKQRLMAMINDPVCPWPGCNTPADDCQVHHIQPFSEGGRTDLDNLIMACAFHNGVNDDHREGTHWGYLDKDGPNATWQRA